MMIEGPGEPEKARRIETTVHEGTDEGSEDGRSGENCKTADVTGAVLKALSVLKEAGHVVFACYANIL
jgi:hypothetical protein